MRFRDTRVHTLGIPGYMISGYRGTCSWGTGVHALGVPGYILSGTQVPIPEYENNQV